MIPANDILARRNEIKDCIAAADMERAVKRLIDFARDFCAEEEDNVLIISMEFYYLLKKEKMGVVNNDDELLNKRRIAVKILNTLSMMTSNLAQA